MVSGTHAIPIYGDLKIWEWYRKLTTRWFLESPLTTCGEIVGKMNETPRLIAAKKSRGLSHGETLLQLIVDVGPRKGA